MTREEAARVLEGMMEDYRISSCDDDWYYGENLEALETAISALREKAERERGCAYCAKVCEARTRSIALTAGANLLPRFPNWQTRARK